MLVVGAIEQVFALLLGDSEAVERRPRLAHPQPVAGLAVWAAHSPIAVAGVGTEDFFSWLFLALSALATGASWVCYFRALQQGDASKVAPVDKFSLVLVALFAFTFLGERPSLREWLGIAMIATGVLVLAIRR